MAKLKKENNASDINAYISKLDHPLLPAIKLLREIVLASDKHIAEHIKWNSPAFFYSGAMKDFDPKEYKRDIVVFNLHKKDQVLLVFPTGARISDKTGLLEGKFADTRKIVKFKSVDEVTTRKKDLQNVIKEWIKGVDE